MPQKISICFNSELKFKAMRDLSPTDLKSLKSALNNLSYSYAPVYWGISAKVGNLGAFL